MITRIVHLHAPPTPTRFLTMYTRLVPKIGQMRLGQVGYTVPWAYDNETNTLHSEYPITKQPRGTSSMRITHIDQTHYEIQVSQTVSVILVIKAGILETSKVFADESEADTFFEAMQAEYSIDPLNPDTCAEDVLHLREEVK